MKNPSGTRCTWNLFEAAIKFNNSHKKKEKQQEEEEKKETFSPVFIIEGSLKDSLGILEGFSEAIVQSQLTKS